MRRNVSPVTTENAMAIAYAPVPETGTRANSEASAGIIVVDIPVTPAASHASSVMASNPASSSTIMLQSRHTAADRSNTNHSSPNPTALHENTTTTCQVRASSAATSPSSPTGDAMNSDAKDRL
eukprot:CAMPEP_0179481762 /NCGR_PEP_ID=MMETSP0799-20121207/59408_1 /TAXON_ID=46947 /ORGANISM="Geminigera cryophila, Strain CCMP2564" /LENGTH=123 /DNA_ID=CAMNT_0021294529 /DNA_START=116 /DNA_END=485 /DNA_ORIENTATION=+